MLGLFGLLTMLLAGAVTEGQSPSEDEEDPSDSDTDAPALTDGAGDLLDDEEEVEAEDPGPWNEGDDFAPEPPASDPDTQRMEPALSEPEVPDLPPSDEGATDTGLDTDFNTTALPDTAQHGADGSNGAGARLAPLIGGDSDAFLNGGAGDDQIEGGAGNDQITGGAGSDTITGGAGDDTIWAGTGDDLASGGEGNDELHGEAGNDSLAGEAGNDWLAGHEGDDLLAGGEGDDSLLGGEGDDSLYGDAGDDWLAGGYGADLMHGSTGADTLDGGDGNDTLYGAFPEGDDGEVDFLNGGAGDDLITLGVGDHGYGGEGADQFTLSEWLGEGGFAHINDYDADEDQIVVVYDPATHLSPQLSVMPSQAGGSSLIALDGFVVAEVNGTVDPADIRLLAA